MLLLILLFLYFHNYSLFKSKSYPKNPSSVRSFSIESIMNHNQATAIKPIKSSSTEFGVMFENNFVVLDDAKHFIGIYSNDAKKLILENVENGSTVKFIGYKRYTNFITTLVFDEKTGSLYNGNSNGNLIQHKVDTANQICKEVKNYGDLGIGKMTSSHRFMDFVFFGGNQGKIKVLDLSTGKLLSGHLETSIRKIYSIQVCKKSPKEIYLAVSGWDSDYTDDKTDLFDITDFLSKDPLIFQKLYSERMLKLAQERDSYKAKLTKMTLKYDDLKKNYDELRNKNKDIKKAYKTLEAKLEIKQKEFTRKMNLLYQHRSNRTTIGNKISLIGSGLFDEIDPLVIIRDLKEDLEEEKNENRQLQNCIYKSIDQRRATEEESRELRIELSTLKNHLATIKQVVRNR